MTLATNDRSLERSYARAERITANWARSFYFASRFLPLPKKRAIFALYDYCRHADNLVDYRGPRSVTLVRADLDALGALVRAMYAGRPPVEERWLGLYDALCRYAIPIEPLLDLLDGVATDLAPVAMPDFSTLHRYCQLVAGGVGLMLGPILGAEHDRYAERGVGLGVAMQLTNVLRDIGEDLANGRVYLPGDELAGFGLSRATLERREVTPSFVALMRFQVARARAYFDAADSVVGLFPADGSRLTVRLLQRTYAGILDEIERLGYDVFSARAYVPSSRKLLILGRALWAERPALPLLSERSA